MGRRNNGEGSVRQLENGSYEAMIQSSVLNPETFKPKRFKRRGNTAEEALTNAKTACLDWEYQIDHNKESSVDKRKTFGSYMEDYFHDVIKTSGITASTYHTYYRTMQRMFWDFDISRLQLQMLSARAFEDYYNEMYSKYAKKSCNTPRQLVIKLCGYLCKRGLIPLNYADLAQIGIRKEVIDEYTAEQEERERTRKLIWSNEDIQKFYQAYRNNTGGEIVLIVLFLIETGVRASEFVVITNKDIDLEQRTLRISKAHSIRFKNIDIPEEGVEYYTKVTKNGEPRTIYLSPLAIELVQIMRQQTLVKCKNNPHDLLYPQLRNGKQRTRSSMEVCLRDLCIKLDIDRDVRRTKTGQMIGLSLHTCRHTYDSIANTAKGANPIATALSMGHKDISVENVYTHLTENARKEIRTASTELLGYESESKVQSRLSSDEEKLLYELLKRKYGE